MRSAIAGTVLYPTSDPDDCEVDHICRKFNGNTVQERGVLVRVSSTRGDGCGELRMLLDYCLPATGS